MRLLIAAKHPGLATQSPSALQRSPGAGQRGALGASTHSSLVKLHVSTGWLQSQGMALGLAAVAARGQQLLWLRALSPGSKQPAPTFGRHPRDARSASRSSASAQQRWGVAICSSMRRVGSGTRTSEAEYGTRAGPRTYMLDVMSTAGQNELSCS